jgi:hypothetical protein
VQSIRPWSLNVTKWYVKTVELQLALKNNVPVFVIKKEGDKMILEKVTDLIQTSEYNLFQYGIVVSKKYSLRSLNKYLQFIRNAKI